MTTGFETFSAYFNSLAQASPLSGNEPSIVLQNGLARKAPFSSATNAVTPKQFGAVADGNSHPLSSFYQTLIAAQAAFPLVPNITSLSQEIDWAASSQAAYTAFGAPGSEHGSNQNLNRPLYFPSGIYFFGNDTLTIRNLQSAIVYGDGEIATQITGNGIVMLFDGLWYTTFRDLIVISDNTATNNIAVFMMEGNSANTPGHTYPTVGVQGCTFINVQIAGGGSQYAMTLGYYSQGSQQGSEMQFINLHLQNTKTACYAQFGFNALDNNFYGGDCQVYTMHGLYSSASPINVFGMSFENGAAYAQFVNGGFDIFFDASGAGGNGLVCGCRSEGMQFLNSSSQLVRVISCWINTGAGITQGWTANNVYPAGASILVGNAQGSSTMPVGYRPQVFHTTAGGTSGNSEPNWTTAFTDGSTISDHTVTWTNKQVDAIKGTGSGRVYVDTNCSSSYLQHPGNMWKGCNPRYLFPNPVTITSNYTLGDGNSFEDVVFVDATAGAVTITVPTLNGVIATSWLNPFTIVKVDGTANHVVVSNTVFGFVGGGSSDTLTSQFQAKTYILGAWTAGSSNPSFGILSHN